MIDGNFALNTKVYEHQDLKDINKETSFGFNFTVYPHATYTMRDQNSNKIYTDGHTLNKVGTTVATQFDLTYIDQSRNVLATIGSGVTTDFDTTGVNRDVKNNVSKWSGIKVEGISINPGTEFWLTEAGRGTYLDQYDDAKEAIHAINRLITMPGSLEENLKAEKVLQRLKAVGYFDTEGKSLEDIANEINSRLSPVFDKDITVKFYNSEDINTENLDVAAIDKIVAQGFAVADDGTFWVNMSWIQNNQTINFNKLSAHEITHLVGGHSEYIANYVEEEYNEFLHEISNTGWLNNSSITGWGTSHLSTEEKIVLAKYGLNEMDFKEYLLTREQAEKLSNYINNVQELEGKLGSSPKYGEKKLVGIISKSEKSSLDDIFVWKDNNELSLVINEDEDEKGKVKVDFTIKGLNEEESDKETDAWIKVISEKHIEYMVASYVYQYQHDSLLSNGLNGDSLKTKFDSDANTLYDIVVKNDRNRHLGGQLILGFTAAPLIGTAISTLAASIAGTGLVGAAAVEATKYTLATYALYSGTKNLSKDLPLLAKAIKSGDSQDITYYVINVVLDTTAVACGAKVLAPAVGKTIQQVTQGIKAPNGSGVGNKGGNATVVAKPVEVAGSKGGSGATNGLVKDGLGKISGKEYTVTQKGVNNVKNYLTEQGFIGDYENQAMLNRLENALSSGQKITGADAVFYTHELKEAQLVASGIEQTVAHEAALQYYKVSPFSVYHPDVIQMEPGWWNNAWYDFWGIER